MSAHVLLDLLNKLRKRYDAMPAKHLSLFHKACNKFNNVSLCLEYESLCFLANSLYYVGLQQYFKKNKIK